MAGDLYLIRMNSERRIGSLAWGRRVATLANTSSPGDAGGGGGELHGTVLEGSAPLTPKRKLGGKVILPDSRGD